MNRRQAIRTMALTSAALAGGRLLTSSAHAAVAPAVLDTPAPNGAFILPPLGYPVDALEPFIDAQTMTIHHDKHHQTYVDSLNKALAGHPDWARRSLDDILTHLNDVPESIRTAVRNHGGGHANHSLFWKCLGKSSGAAPEGPLAEAITGAFGSFDAMKEKFITAGKGVFGSGWAWLTLDADHKLAVESTPNQDSPLTAGRTQLLGLDVWEHAYYLKYQNRRPDYLAALFNVLDWQFIAARYVEIVEQKPV
jgi:Fe-Mn family superoxide dismutase